MYKLIINKGEEKSFDNYYELSLYVESLDLEGEIEMVIIKPLEDDNECYAGEKFDTKHLKARLKEFYYSIKQKLNK